MAFHSYDQVVELQFVLLFSRDRLLLVMVVVVVEGISIVVVLVMLLLYFTVFLVVVPRMVGLSWVLPLTALRLRLPLGD